MGRALATASARSLLDGVDRDYYLRQLRDWKASAEAEGPVAIGGYLGNSDLFDEAVADFSLAYADQKTRTTPLCEPP